VSWLLHQCQGIFSRSDVNSVDFAGNRGEGDWSEEVCIFTLLVCLLWCDTCLEWLRNSNVYIRNGCHIFRTIPCWCANLLQSTKALRPAFLAKIFQTMGTPAMNAGASHSRWIPAPQAIFLEGASASESDFAWILSRFFIILYLPKMMFLKDTCLTYL